MSSFEPLPSPDRGGSFLAKDPAERRFRPVAGGAEVPVMPTSARPPSPRSAEVPDLEAQLRSAFEEGRAAGLAELAGQADEALQSAVDSCERAAKGLVEQAEGYLVRNRQTLLDLATALAEGVLRRELGAQPESLLETVELALSKFDGDVQAKVALSEQDLELLRAGSDAALQRIEATQVRFVADATLRPGDALVSAGPVQVDARVASLLASLRRQLDTCVGAEGPEA